MLTTFFPFGFSFPFRVIASFVGNVTLIRAWRRRPPRVGSWSTKIGQNYRHCRTRKRTNLDLVFPLTAPRREVARPMQLLRCGAYLFDAVCPEG